MFWKDNESPGAFSNALRLMGLHLRIAIGDGSDVVESHKRLSQRQSGIPPVEPNLVRLIPVETG